MILVALVLSIAGCGVLALSMNRYASLFPAWKLRPSDRIAVRLFGAVVLGAAATACVSGWGWVSGLVGCWGVLTFGAGVVTLALSWRARPRPAPPGRT